MSLWEKAAAELLDIIEWTDDSSDTLVWRFPRYENEIKYGSQLIVRPAQAAVFVERGTIADVFPPGQHTLITQNLPMLSTLKGWKYGFQSPFKAEVYFVNTRNFTNLKWGTKNPIIHRDPEFGPVRLRSYGTYVVKITNPAQFIQEIVGTGGHFTLENITEQLRNLIVSRFADTLGESSIPVLDLAANYTELSTLLAKNIASEFQDYGIDLTKLLIENISLPLEVEETLDKKSSMGIVGNLDNYVKFQTAQAMEAAAKNQGGDASAGVGMGMGFAMANQMGKIMGTPQESPHGAPPPLPAAEGDTPYFVGDNGTKKGPFDLGTILGQIAAGTITKDTLLWKRGMSTWEKADMFQECKPALQMIPPPLPK